MKRNTQKTWKILSIISLKALPFFWNVFRKHGRPETTAWKSAGWIQSSETAMKIYAVFSQRLVVSSAHKRQEWLPMSLPLPLLCAFLKYSLNKLALLNVLIFLSANLNIVIWIVWKLIKKDIVWKFHVSNFKINAFLNNSD